MDFGYYFLIRDYKEEDISIKKGHAVYVIQIEDGFAKTSSGAIIDIKLLKWYINIAFIYKFYFVVELIFNNKFDTPGSVYVERKEIYAYN